MFRNYDLLNSGFDIPPSVYLSFPNLDTAFNPFEVDSVARDVVFRKNILASLALTIDKITPASNIIYTLLQILDAFYQQRQRELSVKHNNPIPKTLLISNVDENKIPVTFLSTGRFSLLTFLIYLQNTCIHQPKDVRLMLVSSLNTLNHEFAHSRCLYKVITSTKIAEDGVKELTIDDMYSGLVNQKINMTGLNEAMTEYESDKQYYKLLSLVPFLFFDKRQASFKLNSLIEVISHPSLKTKLQNKYYKKYTDALHRIIIYQSRTCRISKTKLYNQLAKAYYESDIDKAYNLLKEWTPEHLQNDFIILTDPSDFESFVKDTEEYYKRDLPVTTVCDWSWFTNYIEK
jgi:hypothetical protein